MNFSLRRLVLFSLLLITVMAAFWPMETAVDSQIVAVVDRRRIAQPIISAGKPSLPASQSIRSDDSTQATAAIPVSMVWSTPDQDPFGVRDWNPPPPPPPKPPPAPIALPEVAAVPPAPIAPKLPYRFMGRMREENGKDVIYLSKGNDSFAVSAGEDIEKDFRLIKVNDRELTIEYLPMAFTYVLPLDVSQQ